jgi:hypothetical protein
VALLAVRSPKLRHALAKAKQAGHAYVVLDGTVIPIDRIAADRPFNSGKHRRHGMNLQVIASPDGEIVWVSGSLPGAGHDLAAARIWGIPRELAASGLVVLADKGYTGAGDHIRTPCKGKNKPASQKPPTAPMPSCAALASAPTPSSRPAYPAQTPLLPLEGRAARQGYPRPSSPRDRLHHLILAKRPGLMCGTLGLMTIVCC